jgi:hypothetical protein
MLAEIDGLNDKSQVNSLFLITMDPTPQTSSVLIT